MSAFTFNASLGREVELYNRVNGNDPAPSAFRALVLALAGLEDDELLREYDTVAALLAGASNEATNTNYVRQTLTDADLAVYTVDDDANRIVLPFPTMTFVTPLAGDTWRKLVIAYDADTAAGTDADLLPVWALDLLLATTGQPVVPNGQSIPVSFPNGIMVASMT